MAELTCPKCLAPLRTVERNDVVIERCTECGGIFLDRGELERLIAAERTHVEPPDERWSERRREWHDDDDDDDDWRGQPHDKRGKKRRGFLEDLFDFG